MAETLTPKEHIEYIRKTKFSIGGEPNPLTEDLHQSVKNLSAELYAKDVHFLMEIIQNAEDNAYPEGVKPSLEFLVTSRDITGTGAPSTLLIFNNEKGFSARNIESICSVGRSTKKGQRQQGYIGEKGIGFKSVFLITSQPYIFSNGYQIRFGEEPCPHCKLGYIVPEWVEHKPTLQDIQQLYGSAAALPATIIVLPLKPDKEKVVKVQLSRIHPEVLLFLSKIRSLSIREENDDYKLNTVNAISISSETDFVTRKNVGAESYTLILSADENSDHERECSYYMWRQKFPVNRAKRVERRIEVDELIITLAFPNGKRLNRGKNSPGIYAFLPTEMVTHFPFVIQADFVLASSRETILLDNKWNEGILDCVPSAFVNAFISLLKTSEAAPVSSLSRMFQFLPVDCSSYPELNAVRESIRDKLIKENIMPSELCTGQRFFYKPTEVGKIMSPFWNILVKAKDQGINLNNIWTISSYGLYALNSAFDRMCYDEILDFLGVRPMNSEWYSKCIESSNNLVLGLPEEVYLELLFFVADKWSSHFQSTTMKDVLLLKYVGQNGFLHLCSVSNAKKFCIYLSRDVRYISWLINWNKEFKCAAGFFMPNSTQESLWSFPNSQTVKNWLSRNGKVSYISVNEYAIVLKGSLNRDRRLVVSFAHFLCQSLSNKTLSQDEVKNLCTAMPLVNNYGSVVTRSGGVCVPANGSRWVEIYGSNPWRGKHYIELGEDYLRGENYLGVSISEAQLLKFLKDHISASDIPDLCPPDDVFPAVSSPLTKKNAFLLLDWIRILKRKRKLVNGKFLRCIKEGCWLRTIVGVSVSYRPPCQSFLVTSAWGNLLSNESEIVDIPLIDQQFYDNRIVAYKEELAELGVMSDLGEALQFIGKHLKSLAARRNLTKANVFSVLKFIKFLREKFLPPDEFIKSIREGHWLRTTHGEKPPVGTILFNSEWTAASRICDLPFVDQKYYGDEILNFRDELQLLGVLVSFDRDYQRLADCFRMPSSFTSLTVGDVVLILECIRHSSSSNKLVGLLKNERWLNTTLGFRYPSECFLFDSKWECLFQVFSGFPLINDKPYGSVVFTYKNELGKLGVAVGFEDAVRAFVREFKQMTSIHSFTKDNVLSLLKCYRKLKTTPMLFSADFYKCIRDESWLKTCLGKKPPRESILFSSDWEQISQFALLPFIDDSERGYGAAIREYQEELKDIGVVTEFNRGSNFVASGLNLPQNLTEVTPSIVLSLFQCIRNILEEPNDSLITDFRGRLSKRWLKTYIGYRAPNECFLFSSDWNLLLQCEDATFIDEEFYGFDLSVYRKELNAIGVTVDIGNGCDLLANQLQYHSRSDSISRIYFYLNKYDWKPKNKVDKCIWIPSGSNDGQWVPPEKCVLFDKDGLFSLRLKVLEQHYDKKLLTFFSMSFGVRHNPSVGDYCRLWRTWEDSGCQLTYTECCAFWVSIVKHWNSKTKDHLVEMKVPANTGSNMIQLVNKQDVFLPDDLLLMDLFEKGSPDPVSVWFPQPSLTSMPRTKLFEIYSSIGVCPISKAVQKIESSNLDGVFQQVDPRKLIPRDLVKLIFGYLSDPSVNMDSNKRQSTVKPLVDVNVFETREPISVRYTLLLSSGRKVDVNACQMIRWERGISKMFSQKIERSSGHKANLEFAAHFSKVIAEGILWEKEDRISELSELIKLGWLLEFDEEAIDFLLKMKNLQVFMEDVEFLESSFSSK